MTQTVTFDDVWKMFQETDREIKEMARENRERQAETASQIKDVSAQMRETDRQRQDTDRQIKEVSAQMRETDIKFQETKQLVKDLAKQIGNLGGRWGEFVEGLVAPACIALFSARNIQVDEVYTRIKKTVADERMEIDILAANTVDAVLIEVKSHLQIKNVYTHLHRMERFKPLFPRFRACQVYAAVAGIAIDDEAAQFAMENGLFVIVQSGDTVRLANDESFLPRTW